MNINETLSYIQNKAPNFKAKVGIVLGSGLGNLVNHLQDNIVIPYADIPGFKATTVAGHSGNLHLGYYEKLPVACLQGRPHYYEGVNREAFFTAIRTLKLLGCDSVILTNAAGSLRAEVTPGNVVLITDHINFQGVNPLVGTNDETFGPRFVGMQNTYDLELRKSFKDTAAKIKMPLYEGVYISVLGPVFETPAEIRAYRMLGADVVGMSTIPEVIVARHCGLKVAVVSAITNLAADLCEEELSHEVTLKGAKLAEENIFKLVTATLTELAHVQ